MSQMHQQRRLGRDGPLTLGRRLGRDGPLTLGLGRRTPRRRGRVRLAFARQGLLTRRGRTRRLELDNLTRRRGLT